VTGLRPWQLRNNGLIRGRGRVFRKASKQILGTEAAFPEGKSIGVETRNSRASVEVRNEWSCTSTSFIPSWTAKGQASVLLLSSNSRVWEGGGRPTMNVHLEFRALFLNQCPKVHFCVEIQVFWAVTPCWLENIWPEMWNVSLLTWICLTRGYYI
jgi:hypothetical protein